MKGTPVRPEVLMEVPQSQETRVLQQGENEDLLCLWGKYHDLHGHLYTAAAAACYVNDLTRSTC